MKKAVGIALSLVVILLALWILREDQFAPAKTTLPDSSAMKSSSAAKSATPTEPVEVVSEPLQPPAQREAVAPAESKPATPPAPIVTLTLLRVHVAAKEELTPLKGERLELDRQGEGGGCTLIKGRRGRVCECPSTDESGWAEFEVEPGIAHKLSLSGVYWLSINDFEVAPLAQGEQREIEILLPTQDDVVLHGLLVDAQTGQPVAGGAVQVEASESSVTYSGSGVVGTPRRTISDEPPVNSDAAGRFVLKGRSWLRRFVSATAPEYARTVFRLAVGHSDPSRPLEVRISRAATVEVTLADARGGPIAGAAVEFSCPAYFLAQESELHDFYDAPDSVWNCKSDAVGIAIVEGLPPHVPLRLVAKCKGFPNHVEPEPLSLAPGERKSVRLAWGTGGTVRGTVADDVDRPIANLKLWRKASGFAKLRPVLFRSFDRPDAVTRTHELGQFTFEDVPPGVLCIGVAPVENPKEYPAFAETVELKALGAVVEVALKVHAGLMLRGTVVDAAGNPALDCAVSARHTQSGIWVSENSGAEGSFRIGPLPAGTWELVAQAYEGPGAPSLPVLAVAGARDLVLQLRAGSVIAGKITSSSGEESAEFEVSLTNADEFGWMRENSSGLNGEFRFTGILPGSYVVWARDRTGAIGSSARIRLAEGELVGDVKLRLAPGARLELRYTGKDTMAHYAVVVGGQMIESDGLPQGTPTTVTVPAGPIEIRWQEMNTGVENSQSIAVTVGETKEIVWDGKP